MGDINMNGKAITISSAMLRWFLPIVFGAGIAWAVVKDVPKKQEAAVVTMNDHEKRISLVEKDIEYIRNGIDEIKGAMLRGRRRSWSGRNGSPD